MLLAKVQLCTGGHCSAVFLLEFVHYLQSLGSGSTGSRVSLPSCVSLCSWEVVESPALVIIHCTDVALSLCDLRDRMNTLEMATLIVFKPL